MRPADSDRSARHRVRQPPEDDAVGRLPRRAQGCYGAAPKPAAPRGHRKATMPMPKPDPKMQWNVGYWLLAMFALFTLQSLWQARTVEPVPYSELDRKSVV